MRSPLIITSNAARAKAIELVRGLPLGSWVTVQGPQRTIPQERKFRAMLDEVAAQAEHCGRKYRAGVWELLFLAELERETMYLPSLHFDGVVTISYSTSDLSVEEMSLLIEIIFAWGVEHGVTFKEGRDV